MSRPTPVATRSPVGGFAPGENESNMPFEETMLLIDASAGQSPIHGTGLLANEFIPAGTTIWVLKPGFDVVMTKQEFERLAPGVQEQIRRYIYIDVVTGQYILCSDDAKFMNHADAPNTKTEGDRTWAIRDIQRGEELTADYREFDKPSRSRFGPCREDAPP